MSKTVFLIDLENIGAKALNCSQNIAIVNPEVEFVLFYTNNSNKINLSTFTQQNLVNIRGVSCDAGKEMLDKELLIFLTLEFAQKDSKDKEYVIISKDDGFSKALSFLFKYVKGNVKLYKSLQSYYDKVVNPNLSKEHRLYKRLVEMMRTEIREGCYC